ncbi:mannose-1-phosphate guanylyltransferase [Winogradskyella helgolandensis]|uniref:mannose-1-phosphate guanylyltransferase n=1 Tax=Winogradskyella helgolandensis TaxID=2697010 RepID=UPI0015BBC167|nr:mannose-1-phosphate guanylyltransferase [Winogradskyella helgolandensis]
MKTELKYIELVNGFSHDGPAWIGLASFSKSGKTVYFDGKAFQRVGSDRTGGNFYDIESGDEYWISGVKKDMSDRHKFGGGKIFVEKRILNDYLQTIGKTELPKSGYELTEVDTEKPIEKINELENEKLESPEFGTELHFKKPNELSDSELEFVIAELIEDERNGMYKKGRRFSKKKRLEFEAELEKRKLKNVG